MHKGHSEWFSEIIPGILILAFAYFLLPYANISLETSPVIDQTILDAYTRELMTLLQSPAPEKPGMTYGDWLNVFFSNPEMTSLEETALKQALNKELNKLPLVHQSQILKGRGPSYQDHIFFLDARFVSASGKSLTLDNLAKSFPLVQGPITYHFAFFYPSSSPVRVEIVWARMTTTSVFAEPPGYA